MMRPRQRLGGATRSRPVGNYGEIFDAQLGADTPIGLARGLNALWTQGGLIYSPPFR